MTARNPVRAKDRQHQSRFTRPILFVFPTSGTCSCGVAPRDNVLRASAEPRAVWINSLFVASRLHPEMAELYRQKVTTLAQALQEPETRVEATEALRGLIDAIILTPRAGELRIDLKGNLAAMLSAATNAKRSPETGDLSLQVEMVAGARNQRYLQLWRVAGEAVEQFLTVILC